MCIRDRSSLGLDDRLMVDFGLVQRNDYYTGVVFSAYVENYGDAVLMGGRYDTLLKQFDAPMPAIGFAANVDALASVLLDDGRIESVPTPDVLVHAESGAEIKAQMKIRELTANGKICESSVFDTVDEACLLYTSRQRAFCHFPVFAGYVQKVRLK